MGMSNALHCIVLQNIKNWVIVLHHIVSQQRHIKRITRHIHTLFVVHFLLCPSVCCLPVPLPRPPPPPDLAPPRPPPPPPLDESLYCCWEPPRPTPPCDDAPRPRPLVDAALVSIKCCCDTKYGHKIAVFKTRVRIFVVFDIYR